MSSLPVVVVYEDRVSAMPGVALLARSLHRFSPAIEMAVYSPLEALATQLADLANVTWVPTHDLAGRGWNAKPVILQRGLEAHERVLWLDTDVVLRSDLTPHLARYSEGTLVVGQEFQYLGEMASEQRASGFGLTVKRPAPFGINSGSVLADRSHAPLFARWCALLQNEDYLAAQKLPPLARPVAFVGDQDALWALLVSEEFADIPLDYFRLERDLILHCGANGYHVVERLHHLVRNDAAIVHMLGRFKPWSFDEMADWRRDRGKWFQQLCFELSPYFAAALPFAGHLGNPAWLKRRTLPGRLFNALGFGNPALSGLPFALAAWLAFLLFRRRPKL